MRCNVRLIVNGELVSEREEEVTLFKLDEWEKAHEDVREKTSGGA